MVVKHKHHGRSICHKHFFTEDIEENLRIVQDEGECKIRHNAELY